MIKKIGSVCYLTVSVIILSIQLIMIGKFFLNRETGMTITATVYKSYVLDAGEELLYRSCWEYEHKGVNYYFNMYTDSEVSVGTESEFWINSKDPSQYTCRKGMGITWR